MLDYETELRYVVMWTADNYNTYLTLSGCTNVTQTFFDEISYLL